MSSDTDDLNRDSPDGFPRLPTMAAQRAYQHESGPKSVSSSLSCSGPGASFSVIPVSAGHALDAANGAAFR